MSEPKSAESLVTFRINQRTVSAKEGSFLLEAARKAGIDIPTLCNHPDLEPFGACRLCTVEVTHPDWKGWHGLVSACLYPVQNGIEVSTCSDRVIAARKGILSLLAARCPNSESIQALAVKHGAQTSGLASDPKSDNCILCGLCTRVCETYATSAICTVGRGSIKRVSSFADQPPSDCVGCGACAIVCPTGEVKHKRTATDYQVWDRVFATTCCTVDTTRCIGCGACEQACPFSVARVALRVDGSHTAVIAKEHCRGCGACVGACPTGSISQPISQHVSERLSLRVPSRVPYGASLEENELRASKSPPIPRLVVLACPRSNLGDVPPTDFFDVLTLPCIGRVTVAMLLRPLALGSSGVLVLGRHQSTCRFNGAEDIARKRVNEARELLQLGGLNPDRIRFEDPEPGPLGPHSSVEQASNALDALGAHHASPDIMGLPEEREGLDESLTMISAVSERFGDRANTHAFLARCGITVSELAATASETSLLAGSIPALHVLGKEMFAPISMVEPIRAALEVLKLLGMPIVDVYCMPTSPGSEVSKSLFSFDYHPAARMLDDLLRERGAELCQERIGKSARTKVAFDGTQENADLLVALGYEPVDVGPDPLPDRFRITSKQRALACKRLEAAQQAGAFNLLVSTPYALASWALVTRLGAWRSNRVLPVMGVQLAIGNINVEAST